MRQRIDRRSFLKVAGVSIGSAVLYQFAPRLTAGADAAESMRELNGEAPAPFTFVQMSDTHVGFKGPPDPLGTQAFERAVATVNRLAATPELVLFTGDLTHDSDDQDEHAKRMKRFAEIARGIKAAKLHFVPGEHDAALDGGILYREHFGETSYSFDYRGVHFVALDNVSRGRPEVGKERIAWLRDDLARFPKTAPMIVFTHRPLFDLRPDWEWFTSDGPAVMEVLAPYENVTVLYGHIHRNDEHRIGKSVHYAGRSLAFSFPDPQTKGAKKPVAFNAAHPFRNLGIRTIRTAQAEPVKIDEVELTLNEYGTSGIQQFAKKGEV